MSGPSFEEGRYLYCAVQVDGDASFEAEGIEGEPVSILADEGVGLVYHPVEEPYDSADESTVQRWLLAHQEVVDAAGEAFGTPLPMRFDTIITGDDATAREWLADHRAEIADALEELAGKWEYRITVELDREAMREQFAEEDAELAELEEDIDSAGEGTAFLLERQYEDALNDRIANEQVRLAEEVHDLVAPHAESVRMADDESVGVAVLAPRDEERAIGEALETIESRDGCEVRYTGPWPPYSFAPAIGEES